MALEGVFGRSCTVPSYLLPAAYINFVLQKWFALQTCILFFKSSWPHVWHTTVGPSRRYLVAQ